jgi:5-methyltetrahydropteroyltriglutamate--homocysteine methyltransferase
MVHATPPFRSDQVGSLLRSKTLAEARAKRARNAITVDELRAIEDEEVRQLVKKQEDVGLEAITDGEYRRSWWHFDFLGLLNGVEIYEPDEGIKFRGVTSPKRALRIVDKVDFADHPFIEHFKFLKGATKRTPKMTIPSPSVLHFRSTRRDISSTVYPDLDAFFDDVAKAYRKAIKAFYDAGCRYLQLDDTVWAYLCSEKERAATHERGWDNVDELPGIYARVTNFALAEKPADMVVTTHVCRGNFRSSWIAEGGYEPVAEVLFSEVNYDGYFLEYDSDRAGGFEPLRFVPEGRKRVVLGLVTSKSGELEKKDDIKRRIDEATKYVALDQCCLSPQCGFASTEEGNMLSEEEQWKKLAMVVEIARETWGET